MFFAGSLALTLDSVPLIDLSALTTSLLTVMGWLVSVELSKLLGPTSGLVS